MGFLHVINCGRHVIVCQLELTEIPLSPTNFSLNVTDLAIPTPNEVIVLISVRVPNNVSISSTQRLHSGREEVNKTGLTW